MRSLVFVAFALASAHRRSVDEALDVDENHPPLEGAPVVTNMNVNINGDDYQNQQYVPGTGVEPVLTPWANFDIHNPVPTKLSGVDSSQALVFDVMEVARAGRLADYKLFYLGTTAAPARAVEVYQHLSQRMEMNVKLKNLRGQDIARWNSGQSGTGGARATMRHRAYLSGVSKKETFYTLLQLTPRGANKEFRLGKLGNLKVTKHLETFVADAGKCPAKKTCGKRVLMAQGHKEANWMKFYQPCLCPVGSADCDPSAHCNSYPVGHLVKIDQSINWKAGGKVEVFRLTIAPGQDPWLMLNMVTFIDTTNNIEKQREKTKEAFAKIFR